MSARKSSPRIKRLGIAASLLPMLLLAGCADYLNHDDGVRTSAGNAGAYNKVVHIADPWPPYSADNRIPGQGQRVDVVTKRYLAGPRENANSSGSGSAASSEPPAPDQSPKAGNQ
jgi:hypothetical protein